MTYRLWCLSFSGSLNSIVLSLPQTYLHKQAGSNTEKLTCLPRKSPGVVSAAQPHATFLSKHMPEGLIGCCTSAITRRQKRALMQAV